MLSFVVTPENTFNISGRGKVVVVDLSDIEPKPEVGNMVVINNINHQINDIEIMRGLSINWTRVGLVVKPV